MTVLRSAEILNDDKNQDAKVPDAITALTLNQKALSDVSCLSDFKNLERLDLGFNNLSSLEGLKSCVNLKWLSVAQNKLHSLKGIEGLIKLTVLNAGKNKLRSMDDLGSLMSLCALILNDNEIDSICRLDKMKELNTLVLSRNPIHEIGKSLFKVKSITKLSLSDCQLQSIESSLESCTELKELRLAHNNIKTIPAELAKNAKVQNLDLGNNMISSWSDLKVLSSLVNLKNINLQGNPIAKKDKLAKKIKKLVPNLQIFNGRPIDKIMKNEKGDEVDNSSPNVANMLRFQKQGKLDHGIKNKNKHFKMSQSEDGQHGIARGLEMKTELKHKKKKNMELLKEKYSNHEAENTITEMELKDELKKVQQNQVNVTDDCDTPLEGKKRKTDNFPKDKVSDDNEVSSAIEKKLKRRSKNVQRNEVDVIDDGDTPFIDLFDTETSENATSSVRKQTNDKTIQDVNAIDGLVSYPGKRKKFKSQGKGHHFFQPAVEVGLGGPSTWDDE